MIFTPRPYQTDAINAALEFFKTKKLYNAIAILPTGSGKSVVIANITKELEGNTLVFQPSKEILEQNFAKYVSYGFRASIYSASAGQKRIEKVTFATIGSVSSKSHLFTQFKNIIVDECHLVNPKGGMYHDFIKSVEGCKVLGLTATPYRLTNSMEGAMLKWLTRTSPRIFNKVLFYIQNSVLFDSGHLATLKYFTFNVVDRKMLQLNSTGSDFTAQSLSRLYKQINMAKITAEYGLRLLEKRKNILIFCTLIDEANEVSKMIPGSIVITGSTEKRQRERILAQFKSGKIKAVINVGVLTTGFDYPELECVLIARSTMSLALYYQIVGRAMRPHKDKQDAWIVDLGGNISFFGKIETMKIMQDKKGLYSIWNNGRQLTNTAFTKN